MKRQSQRERSETPPSKKKKKLKLDKETVRVLSHSELEEVAGGVFMTNTCQVCG